MGKLQSGHQGTDYELSVVLSCRWEVRLARRLVLGTRTSADVNPSENLIFHDQTGMNTNQDMTRQTWKTKTSTDIPPRYQSIDTQEVQLPECIVELSDTTWRSNSRTIFPKARHLMNWSFTSGQELPHMIVVSRCFFFFFKLEMSQ